MVIDVKKGDYFNFGKKYFIQFSYDNREQQKRIFELFDSVLIPSYGVTSSRAKETGDAIMPYLVDSNGNFSTLNTGIVGGTSIPEDLLALFIKRFVEVDGATVRVGDSKIEGTFDYDLFNELLSKNKLRIELKKDNYFNYGDRYFIQFNYGNIEQQKRIFELFDKVLIPSYGVTSSFAKETGDAIMPYLVDSNGDFSIYNTGIIGGTDIPEELLASFIERFVEVDDAVVKFNDREIKDTFDYDEFEDMLLGMNRQKIR